MGNDTSLGDGQSQFPSTVWDVLERPAHAELNSLAERYWRPVYKFIRSVWNKPLEDAKDLTQEFFATVFDRDFLRAADRRRGNFRQFVLASLRNFLTDRQRAQDAQKRGGDRLILSMDVGDDGGSFDVADPSLSQEQAFDRVWAAEILRRALDQLRAECDKQGLRVRFEAFHRHSLVEGGGASYRDIARDLGVSEFDVGNHLVAARRDLRRICSLLIRETVSDPAALDAEMKALFGA